MNWLKTIREAFKILPKINFKKMDIKTILIIILCAISIYQLYRSSAGLDIMDVIDGLDPTEIEVIYKVDTVYIETEVYTNVYVPEYITKVDTVEVIIPFNIDTLNIIRDYFSIYEVIDTLNLVYVFPESDKLFRLGHGILRDTISENRILSRDILWNYRIPVIQESTTILPKTKSEIYLGGLVGLGGPNVITNIGFSTLVQNRRNDIFQIGFGLQTNVYSDKITPYVSGAKYWRINR
jgi:hypothetical protein